MTYNDDELDVHCPDLAPSESDDDDSESDDGAQGLRGLCPNPQCYRSEWSDYGDCMDCQQRQEEARILRCANLVHRHCRGHLPIKEDNITDNDYLEDEYMTDDEISNAFNVDNITEDSDENTSNKETQGISSSSISEDLSPNPAPGCRIRDIGQVGHARIRRDSTASPGIQLYSAETCPGIPRTGNTPDIPWWETFGNGDFCCEAEAWLWMCENGMKSSEATKARLRDDMAEWKAKNEIKNDISDIVENLESFAIPIQDDDDEQTAQDKSDYN